MANQSSDDKFAFLSMEEEREELRRLREENIALRRVERAARFMPRETPAPGGVGTEHPFMIEAGVVWALDYALTALDRHREATHG